MKQPKIDLDGVSLGGPMSGRGRIRTDDDVFDDLTFIEAIISMRNMSLIYFWKRKPSMDRVLM